MSINSINNPYLQQVLAQNLSSANIKPNALQDSYKLLSSATSAKAGIASISSNGSKINEISREIRKSGDLQAYKGFETAISNVSSNADPLKLTRFSTSASALGQRDSDLLVESFSNIGSLANEFDSGLANAFTNTLTSTMERAGTDGVASLNSVFKSVNEADYSSSSTTLQKNMEGMLSSVQTAIADNDSGAVSGNMSRLAKGVELQPSADSIWNFFNDYTGSGPAS